MQIDTEEQKLVEQHRFDRAISETQLSTGHLIVSIASQWAEYSKDTGCGLTYSEFCEGFNFDDKVDDKYIPYRKFIYECIKRMYSVVNDISTEIGYSIATQTKSGA